MGTPANYPFEGSLMRVMLKRTEQRQRNKPQNVRFSTKQND